MANIINGDNGVVSGTAGLKSSSDGTGILALQTNGTTAVTVDASQNVGIGATTVNGKLNISNAGATGFEFYVADGSSTNNSLLSFNRSTSAYNDLKISTNTTVFAIAGVEKARIDSSGSLLVATTTKNSSGVVEIKTTIGTDNALVLKTAESGAGGTATMVQTRYNATTVGSITSTSSATAYNTSSDYRLKNTITPMTGAIAKVAQLKPVTYKWNVDNSDGEGFIAHELAEVCPQAVYGEKDAVNTDGDIVPQGIDTSFLVATLTAAIQEQQALITSLTARITALEAK